MKRWAAVSALPILFAGSGALPTHLPDLTRTSEASPRTRPVLASPRFSPDQREAYWTDQVIAYIRPGLKVLVSSVTIGDDRKPRIDFRLTDSFDQPLDRLGKVTPGPISINFVLSWYDPATQYFTNYATTTETA